MGPFDNARDNISPGDLTPIDQLDTRLFAAAIYKNKLSANGKVLQENTHQFAKGNNNVLLSLSGLSNGTYIAVVYN